MQSGALRFLKWFVIIAVVAALFAGCAQMLFSPRYEYAVDRNAVKLECRTFYYDERDKRFDFYTVLYTEQDCSQQFINYPPFTVYVNHLALPYSEGYRQFVSTLHFEFRDRQKHVVDVQRHAVDVLMESIRLSHTTEAGVLLRADSTAIRETPYEIEYQKMYSKNRPLPNRLIEHIYFQIRVEGRLVTVEKEYPIVKAPSYTLWDVLMGV
jgi:hypothetical protein